MGTAINLFQAIDADMSITLGGREACVPEHLLYRAQIRSRIEHMSGEAMAKSVRRYRSRQTCIHDPPGQDHLHCARGEPSSAQIRDHGPVELPRNRHRAPPGDERV